MLTVDLVGLLLTICLVGLRYPLHVLGAALLHELGRVAMALFLHGHIQSVLAAGAFSATAATDIKSGIPTLLLAFSGPLANYIVSAGAGGIERERTANILNPTAAVRHPFAVVNLRLALLSMLVIIWNLL